LIWKTIRTVATRQMADLLEFSPAEFVDSLLG
jgi:hypothetical protein